MAGDARDEEHIEAVFAAAADKFGPVSVLLHAAATHGTPMKLADVSLEEWEHVTSTNLRSTFLSTRSALRQMVPEGRGSIVLVASAGILRGFPLAAPYAASKSALVGYARTLAAEVSPDGVRVNVLTPGAMTTTAITTLRCQESRKRWATAKMRWSGCRKGIPAMRRPCTVEEMGLIAVFLAPTRPR